MSMLKIFAVSISIIVIIGFIIYLIGKIIYDRSMNKKSKDDAFKMHALNNYNPQIKEVSVNGSTRYLPDRYDTSGRQFYESKQDAYRGARESIKHQLFDKIDWNDQFDWLDQDIKI